MILMIDNYDSFTYNLVDYFGQLGKEVKIYRNDTITVGEIAALYPEAIVISPGPKRPQDAGVCVEVIKNFKNKIPILGVCLGHQVIGVAFGGTISKAAALVHGKTSPIFNDGRGIFLGLPSPLTAVRYHSLVIQRDSVPDCLEVSACTEDGEVMAIRHREYRVEGVQFHPESILTIGGKRLLKNFLKSINHDGEGTNDTGLY
ncbi:MAG: aminodeoxychorismate/anthranilate synthase component II [Deltaproteobacteria bacterium]|nr:aminodeoxychorismate/anthranilate synthase component II [Deltaproteobacteria bacterium]